MTATVKYAQAGTIAVTKPASQKLIVLVIAFALIAILVFLSFNRSESWYLPVLIVTLLAFVVYMRMRRKARL